MGTTSATITGMNINDKITTRAELAALPVGAVTRRGPGLPDSPYAAFKKKEKESWAAEEEGNQTIIMEMNLYLPRYLVSLPEESPKDISSDPYTQWVGAKVRRVYRDGSAIEGFVRVDGSIAYAGVSVRSWQTTEDTKTFLLEAPTPDLDRDLRTAMVDFGMLNPTEAQDLIDFLHRKNLIPPTVKN